MFKNIAFGLMTATGWFAKGYRNGMPAERFFIWPVWAVLRLVSRAAWWIAHRELKAKQARET